MHIVLFFFSEGRSFLCFVFFSTRMCHFCYILMIVVGEVIDKESAVAEKARDCNKEINMVCNETKAALHNIMF